MPDLFVDGNESSQALLVETLEGLRSKGQQVLDDLETARLQVLLKVEQGLSAMNARRQRANRLVSSNIIGRFVVSDFSSIDQANTTATVRADSQSVTLKERKHPSDGNIRSTKFSPSTGSYEQFGDMFRTMTEDGKIPTGIFEVEFVAPMSLNLVVFDIVTFPSNPEITVQSTENGVTWTDATQTSISGYRVNAWMAPGAVKKLRIQITPSQPDTIGGSTFTFGLTNFNAENVEFHLRADLVMRPITIRPRTQMLRFQADADPSINYFLSFDNQSYFEVIPGKEIHVPGATRTSTGLVGLDAEGKLQHTVPENLYLSSFAVSDVNDQLMRIAPNLNPLIPPASNFYITVNGQDLHLTPFDIALHQGLNFRLDYVSGPPELQVWLRVRLSTESRYTTPIFRGARLEEI